MQADTTYLFVYGSLRKGFQHPAYQYISSYFELVGNAKVKGKLYDLGNYPAGQPCDEDCYIVGELYSLCNKDEHSWAFGQLDDYEGIDSEEGEPAEFRRDKVNVYINDSVVNSWIYWYNRPVTGFPPISSGDVLEYLQRKKSNS